MEDEETVNLNKISFVQPFFYGSTRGWIDHCTKPFNVFYNYMWVFTVFIVTLLQLSFSLKQLQVYYC